MLSADRGTSGYGQTFLKYFTDQALAVGDSITVKWKAKIEGFGANPGSNIARFGLFNSGGSEITGNTAQSDAAMANYTGYAFAVTDIRAYSGTPAYASIEARDRVNANNSIIAASAAYSTFGTLTTNGYELMDTNVMTQEQTIKLTRTSSGWDYYSVLGGSQDKAPNITTGSFADASPTATFDTLVFWYKSGNDGSTITYTLDDVSVEVIPEPATLGMFGFVLAAILGWRRLMS